MEAIIFDDRLKQEIEALEMGGNIQPVAANWVPVKYATPKFHRFLKEEMAYAYAKMSHLMYFGRLPASTRTKRLRKKRRSIIMKWNRRK